MQPLTRANFRLDPPKLTGNGKPATSQRVFSVFLGPGIELEVFDEDLTLFPHE
jgi:hypothetical protein